MHDTLPLLQHRDFPPLRRARLDTLQVNLGCRCNQSSLHCHVNAGPNRTEMMDGDTVDLVLQVLQARSIGTLDLTGGAPRLNEHLRRLVADARAADVAVIDRSIAELQALIALGCGKPGSGRVLNLAYDPQGAVLPPQQAALQADNRRELQVFFGTRLNRLYALANMPIQRFGSTPMLKYRFTGSITLLEASHGPENLETVMCNSLVSVGRGGTLYDCDGNQMPGLPARLSGKATRPHPPAPARSALRARPARPTRPSRPSRPANAGRRRQRPLRGRARLQLHRWPRQPLRRRARSRRLGGPMPATPQHRRRAARARICWKERE